MFFNAKLSKKLIPQALLLSIPFTFLAPVSAETKTCSIQRKNPNVPPIGWHLLENLKEDKKQSILNSESCDVPENSIIKSFKIAYDFRSNFEIMTKGLPQGWYGLEVKGNSPALPSAIVGYSGDSGIKTYNVREVGSGAEIVPEFEGVDLHNLKIDIASNVRDASNVSCTSTTTRCQNFVSATYSLYIDYDTELTEVPLPPSWIVATPSGKDVTVRWENIGDVTYKVAIKYNSLNWTDYNYVPSPAASTSLIFKDLNPGNRSYKVIACNSAGCSEPSVVSNIATTEAEVFKLDTPNQPFAIATGSSVYVDWDEVSGADRYAVSIKFNNNNWTSFNYFTNGNAPQISWSNLGSGARQYRVKACKDGVCYDSSLPSNIVRN